MITIQEAFNKFRSRLELTEGEQKDASRRQKEIREEMDKAFSLDDDFLTGSYKRATKIKPLRDVDIFCVMGEEERHYREKHPSSLLDNVRNALKDKYGEENVVTDERCVTVKFDAKVKDEDESTEDQVVGFDVVPAFQGKGFYEIPSRTGKWIKTDPKVHEELANKAQVAFDKQWKFTVRMIKKWNSHHQKPIPSSFLLEVMALDILRPPFGGDHRRELKSFFATAADRIMEDWNDPAKLGEPLTASMSTAQRIVAQKALRKAAEDVTQAIQLARSGKEGEALRFWRDNIFGPMFPLS